MPLSNVFASELNKALCRDMDFKKYLSDYKQIVRLGLPIIVGQAGMIVVGFADNVMVGRYTTEALSSASFVNNVFNMASLACMGFTYGITPIAGALFGKGKHARIGELMRNALVLNVLYSLLVTALMTLLYFNLEHLNQPEELLPLIRPYYLLYLCGLLPMTLFNVWAQCSYGMKCTAMPMWIILAANLLNVFGNWILIYGNLGAPELGLFGAGLATLAARIFTALAIMEAFFCSRRFATVRAGFARSHIGMGRLSKLFGTSFPVSLQLFFETAAFSGASIFVGWLGATELAACQVMITVGTLGFCFYYSLGSATSVLVANAAGRCDFTAMRRIGFAGYHLTLFLAVCACLTFIFGGSWLIGLFTTDPKVIVMALTLIPPMVTYQLGDATQINFANALRGTSRVMPMLWIAFVSYMLLGLPSSYLFAFPLSGGIVGIFYSFSVSLFAAGALFLFFFLKYTARE